MSVVQSEEESKEATNLLTIRLYKDYNVNINKSLILLKTALFFYYGAGSSIWPFMIVYFKQRGLTIQELSFIFMILPPVHLLGPSLSGIMADKLGNKKIVLQANLILAILSISSMLLIPSIKPYHSDIKEINISCNSQSQNGMLHNVHCKIETYIGEDEHLYLNCPRNSSLDITNSFVHNRLSECTVTNQITTSRNGSVKYASNEAIINCLSEISLQVENVNKSTWRFHDCNSSCHPTNGTKQDTCGENLRSAKLFVLSSITLMFCTTFLSNCYRTLDVTAMSMIKIHKSSFGRQRVWAMLGNLVFTPFYGYIVDLASDQAGGPKNYNWAFYLFVIVAAMAMAAIWKLDVKIEPPTKKMCRKASKILRNIDVLAFLLAVLVLGAAWGFKRMFHSWYLEELQASSFLLGLVFAISSIAGLPVLFTSSWWIREVGRVNLIILGLVSHAVWNVGYSFLVNPWWALLCEISEVFSYHLLWVAVATQSNIIAPEGLKASVVAIAGGIHYGIGKGSGSLIGGLIMSRFGGPTAFRVMAAICATSAVLYYLFLRIRRKHSKKDTRIADEEETITMF